MKFVGLLLVANIIVNHVLSDSCGGGSNCRAETIFVVDSSSSVGTSGWDNAVSFVTGVIDGVSGDHTHFGIIEFDSDANTVYSSCSAQDDCDVIKNSLTSLAFSGGGTNIPAGVQAAIDMFNACDDPDLVNVMILITDGVGGDPCSLKATLDSLGVTVFLVEVGTGVSSAIHCLVDDTTTDIFTVSDFNDINSYIDTLTESTCAVAQPSCDSQDVVFAIDESGSISSAEFIIETDFIKQMVLDIDRNSTVGILSFATSASEVYAMTNDQSRSVITAALDANTQSTGRTNFEDAIDLGISMITTQGTDKPNVLVILSDGNPNEPDGDPCDRKVALDAANIVPVIIGVGPSFTSTAVDCLVNDPALQIVEIDGFTQDDVDEIIDFVTELICGADTCPKYDFEECTDCTCSDFTNCDSCDESEETHICTQCSDNYFLPSLNYDFQCANCQDIFGEECLSCVDFVGCTSCDLEYELAYNPECGVFECEDQSCDLSPSPCPIDVDESNCPVACDSSPCSCNDECQFCNVCHVNGCNECESGYFKKDYNYPCINCQEYFGNQCMFCQDFNGCGQCQDGYTRTYNSDCQLWECL